MSRGHRMGRWMLTLQVGKADLLCRSVLPHANPEVSTTENICINITKSNIVKLIFLSCWPKIFQCMLSKGCVLESCYLLLGTASKILVVLEHCLLCPKSITSFLIWWDYLKFRYDLHTLKINRFYVHCWTLINVYPM